MQPARLLVVCTANICRSPFAERLFAEYFVRHAPDIEVHVASAGTHARPGGDASSGMQRIAEAWGLDLSYHRSRRVDADLVAAQDLVLTMEDAQRTTVSRLGAGVGQRTFAITELAALVAEVDRPEPPVVAGDAATTHGPLGRAVGGWQAVRARWSVHAPDVEDPYGRSREHYERCAHQLARLVDQLGPVIATAVRTPGAPRGLVG